MKTLVIIESPGKKETISGILGGDFIVEACYGHVRDLPQKDRGIDADYAPRYMIQEDRAKRAIAKLKEQHSHVDRTLYATDPDREGEAIAWHVSEVLGDRNPQRVTFGSITPDAVRKGIAAPRAIDMHLVRAQEARRVGDRMIGWDVSPKLARLTGENVSAGRVQTPALRLVVEREQAIRGFGAVHHFGVELRFGPAPDWTAQLDAKVHGDEGGKILDAKLAEAAARVRNLTVAEYSQADKLKPPPPPFNTSTLQQEAQRVLKLRPQKTMELAQKLYEGTNGAHGAITYMRTDSPNFSEEGFAMLAEYGRANGLAVVPEQRRWKAKESAQEAHDCIRPTDFAHTSAGSTDDERALYKLIWQRAVASQLPAAVYAQRTAVLVAAEADAAGKAFRFVARSSVLTAPGWRAVYDSIEDDADGDDEGANNAVPVLQEGAAATADGAKVTKKKTQPPKRFTLSTLTKRLEELGIGRPSTYAAIGQKLIEKGYMTEAPKTMQLQPTPLAETLVTKAIGRYSFVDYAYTRELEEDLDAVAEGKADYLSVVRSIHGRIEQENAAAAKEAPAHACPACESAMRRLRRPKGKEGFFWGCSAYPHCTASLPDDNGKPGVRASTQPPISTSNAAARGASPAATYPCPSCADGVLRRRTKSAADDPKKKGWDFWGCSNYNAATKCNKTYKPGPGADGAPDLFNAEGSPA